MPRKFTDTKVAKEMYPELKRDMEEAREVESQTPSALMKAYLGVLTTPNGYMTKDQSLAIPGKPNPFGGNLTTKVVPDKPEEGTWFFAFHRNEWVLMPEALNDFEVEARLALAYDSWLNRVK